MTIEKFISLRYNNMRSDGNDHWDSLAFAICAYNSMLSVNIFIGWSNSTGKSLID